MFYKNVGVENMSIDVTGFSFSGISTFKSCPRAYRYRYIDKLPEAFSSIEAYMGSSVHEVLEWTYSQRQQGYEPTMEMAWQQYRYTWNNGDFQKIKIVKENKTREDYFLQGQEFIGSFFQRVFPYDRSTTLYLEHKFELPLEENIIYRGVIDRIAKETDGTLIITDYKTGRVGHPLDNLQLPSYALYVFLHNIDQQIRLCLEDLREQRSVAVTFNRKEAKKVKEELLKEIEQIRNSKEEDFITNPSILCLWCGYNHICPNPYKSASAIGQSATNSNESGNGSNEFQEACPLCGGQLQERNGKFGPFLGCSNFPQCRYTLDLSFHKGNLAENPEVEGKDICPECGSLLKKRNGKYGAFMGCSNYPECRFTRKIGE
jgi:ssDNA-binding Zn-finger/Zn-ribbon topoisomerase 1/RecB family exonuclease